MVCQMIKPNEAIIIGGGKSIQEGIQLGLRDKLKNRFVFCCNYAYKHFDGTLTTFVDREFYHTRNISQNPDIYEELKMLPLIVGLNNNGVEEFKLNNTILLKASGEYHAQDMLTEGFFHPCLTGIFSLSLAQFLLTFEGTIFLLGYDWTRRPIGQEQKIDMHYYDTSELTHRGIGFSRFYEGHNPDRYFKKMLQEKLKVYNVSLDSNINTFEKISYTTFFQKLNTVVYDQNELRTYVKDKLCTK